LCSRWMSPRSISWVAAAMPYALASFCLAAIVVGTFRSYLRFCEGPSPQDVRAAMGLAAVITAGLMILALPFAIPRVRRQRLACANNANGGLLITAAAVLVLVVASVILMWPSYQPFVIAERWVLLRARVVSDPATGRAVRVWGCAGRTIVEEFDLKGEGQFDCRQRSEREIGELPRVQIREQGRWKAAPPTFRCNGRIEVPSPAPHGASRE
jgi:hypothetical protein